MPQIPFSSTIPNSISYTLCEDYANTSGAIFDASGVLVRTLWANELRLAGTHTVIWDGKDDDGFQQAYTNYTLRVSSNNIQYIWDGGIGNNYQAIDPSIHRYYDTMACMVEVGSYMYYGTIFSEQDSAQWKLLKTDPTQKIRFFPGGHTGDTTCNSKHVCANGDNVYWGGSSYRGAGNFVIATSLAPATLDKLVQFSAGTNYSDGSGPMQNYTKVIDVNSLWSSGAITGMAVQQAGSKYLFVSHGWQSVINVFRTDTGAQVQTINTGGTHVPTGVTVSTANSGGALPANTYYYMVIAIDARGFTLPSVDVNVTTTGSSSKNTINWTAVSGATSYRVYRTTIAPVVAGTPVPVYSQYYPITSLTTCVDVNLTSATAGAPPPQFTANPGITRLFLESDTTLWAAQATTVTKYTVNSDGTITATASQLTGFTNVVGLSVHAGDLCVFDGGTQSIVKRYNSSTLASTGTIGQVGGYSVTAAVANDKFYVYDNQVGDWDTNIAHQSDGSIWILDPGNWRYQKFDSFGMYVSSIYYMPRQYDGNICGNDPKRVFCYFREYAVDYTKPITSAWTLVANWGYSLSSDYFLTASVSAVSTLSNNRTYMLLTPKNATNYYQAELVDGGNLRFISTGLSLFCRMNNAGDLYNQTSSNNSGDVTITYTKQTLKPFTSNDPTYNTATTIATIDVGTTGPNTADRYFYETTSGRIAIFDANTLLPRITVASPLPPAPSYHLGLYDGTTYGKIATTLRSTFADPNIPASSLQSYTGDYPFDGKTMDVGNSVSVHNGGSMVVIGNHILLNIHGEFWKNSQTGLIYHYDDYGMLQGMFGSLGLPTIFTAEAQPGFASNTQSTQAVQIGSDIYVFQNDESKLSMYHRWHITNLSSITNQCIDFTLTSRTPPSISPNKVDLLSGVIERQVSINGSPGWSQFPVPDQPTGSFILSSLTRKAQYDFNKSADVLIKMGSDGTTPVPVNGYYVNRAITSLTNLTQWTLSGRLDFSVGSFAGLKSLQSHYFFSILDPAKKEIVRLEPLRDNTNGFKLAIVFNNQTIYIPQNLYGSSQFVIKPVNSNSQILLLINMFGQWFTSIQGPYDPAADITNPKDFRVSGMFSSVATNNQLGIIELFFDGK